MAQLELVESGKLRDEIGRQALSAILRRDTATFNAMMAKLAPRPTSIYVIAGRDETNRLDLLSTVI